ncbi:IS110 family transposase [Pseudoalteromonas sp. NC201]|uniref:IS110 family transposase n=1 Tax=Pseudoalteromonas sp. NC201 TaxID=1514074 RepID=UPI000CA33475|nr:IS110 family transposase [Pseudoalteromonas sp. NC201]AUJ71489.1 Transposase IS116/IS110/IS902 family protein [Pseudoalteromonas sp. NC201]
MTQSNLIAIDLAKNIFQVAQLKGNKLKFNKPMKREPMFELLAKAEGSKVVMEACGSAQLIARKALSLGHDVMLLPPKFVKAFRQGQKTDANDVLAIASASQAYNVKPCKIMTVEEQTLQSLSQARTLVDKQKTQLSNQIRGLLLEFGIVINQGDAALTQVVPDILEDAENALPIALKQALAVSYDLYKTQCDAKAQLHKQVEAITKQNESCQRLMALEGVGPITAIELLSFLGNTSQFSNARGAAACAGVTPTQHSSGGKAKIGHIPKRRGNTLRKNLFLGARTVVSRLKHKEATTEKERWIKNLLTKKSVKCVAIALANKTVRTAYALLKNGSTYEPKILAV